VAASAVMVVTVVMRTNEAIRKGSDEEIHPTHQNTTTNFEICLRSRSFACRDSVVRLPMPI
jgi:hypothetical protein